MSRKFHRYVFHVEVLSEEPLGPPDSLEHLYGMLQEDCTERFLTTEHEEIDGPTMARLVIEHENDPEWFDLDDEGNDL